MNTEILKGDPITWAEYHDHRCPGRTILLGVVGDVTYAASFCTNREKAREAIRAASRAQGKVA